MNADIFTWIAMHFSSPGHLKGSNEGQLESKILCKCIGMAIIQFDKIGDNHILVCQCYTNNSTKYL